MNGGFSEKMRENEEDSDSENMTDSSMRTQEEEEEETEADFIDEDDAREIAEEAIEDYMIENGNTFLTPDEKMNLDSLEKVKEEVKLNQGKNEDKFDEHKILLDLIN